MLADVYNNCCSNKLRNTQRVNTMLTVKNTTKDDDCTNVEYTCNFVAECDGSSFWGDTAGRRVNVTGISVSDFGDFKSIYVTHDSTWDIYTDKGFARAISNALGYRVGFTEQGMQEDNLASME